VPRLAPILPASSGWPKSKWILSGRTHELRTPLTVIRTAAFNLRGKVATNPSQVERYGALIQQESERAGAIVEQVLLASIKPAAWSRTPLRFDCRVDR
jgi:nitrogen-specific signal transduction histidine kinase